MLLHDMLSAAGIAIRLLLASQLSSLALAWSAVLLGCAAQKPVICNQCASNCCKSCSVEQILSRLSVSKENALCCIAALLTNAISPDKK